MASKSKRLAAARKKKSQAARMLGALEAGEVGLVIILNRNPVALQAVRIEHLLRRAPHMGEKGARKTLEEAQIWPLRRVGDLTSSERQRIINQLPRRAKKEG